MADLTEFACPHCNHLYQLTPAQMAKYGGKTIRCKNCQQKFQAPDLEAAYASEQQATTPEPVATEEPQPAEQYPAAEAQETQEAQQDIVVQMSPPAPEPEPQQFLQQAPSPPPRQNTSQYRASAAGGSSFMQYLTFRKYVTPFAVQIVFWVGVAASVFAGVTSILAGITIINKPVAALAMFLGGISYIIVLPVLMRIGCELIVVIFRIYETLQDEQQSGRKR